MEVKHFILNISVHILSHVYSTQRTFTTHQSSDKHRIIYFIYSVSLHYQYITFVYVRHFSFQKRALARPLHDVY